MNPPLKLWVAARGRARFPPRWSRSSSAPPLATNRADGSSHHPNSQLVPRRCLRVLCPRAELAERVACPARRSGHSDRHQLRQRLRGRRAGYRRAPGRSGPTRGGQAGHGAPSQDRRPGRLRGGRDCRADPGGQGDLVVHSPRAAVRHCGVGLHRGPAALRISGPGEVFVFVFFGLWRRPVRPMSSMRRSRSPSAAISSSIPTTGPTRCWAGVPVGLLAAALLEANNVRDLETDTEAGRRRWPSAWDGAARASSTRERSWPRLSASASWPTSRSGHSSPWLPSLWPSLPCVSP